MDSMKPLTEKDKQKMRDELEKAMSVTGDDKVFIAINTNGEGVCWQANNTYGELALQGHTAIAQLLDI